MINYVQPMPTKKVIWERVGDRYWLKAKDTEYNENIFHTPTELQMDTIHEWCKANDCGRRMSFSEFRFKDEKEMSLFLLRWS